MKHLLLNGRGNSGNNWRALQSTPVKISVQQQLSARIRAQAEYRRGWSTLLPGNSHCIWDIFYFNTAVRFKSWIYNSGCLAILYPITPPTKPPAPVMVLIFRGTTSSSVATILAATTPREPPVIVHIAVTIAPLIFESSKLVAMLRWKCRQMLKRFLLNWLGKHLGKPADMSISSKSVTETNWKW